MRTLFIIWLAALAAAGEVATGNGTNAVASGTNSAGVVFAEDMEPEPGPWVYSNEFHNIIKYADRMVIRNGGFGCCEPIDKQKVLTTITNLQELAEVYTNLQFVTKQDWGLCECCGYPGLDWYRGTNRLALTSVQHCDAIRWEGFPGDASLTENSRKWLRAWLKRRNIKTVE